MRRNDSRPGFTLVELLVVMAIIGILTAMILPAIQRAIEAARRVQCLNNEKNIGLALRTFESRMKSFPPGLPTCRTKPTPSLGRKQLGPIAKARPGYNKFFPTWRKKRPTKTSHFA